MELPNYSRQLLLQLHTLCKEQKFCDCTIFIGTFQFRAQKLVLAAASLLFKSLLESTDTISIDASVVTADEFSLLMEMMYSGKLPPGKHNLTKIISVADSLQMFDVAVSCKNLLTELMSHSTQSQKLKESSVQSLTVNKIEIYSKQNSLNVKNISSELTPAEHKVSPVSTAAPFVSPAEKSNPDKCPDTPPVATKLETEADLHTASNFFAETTTEMASSSEILENNISSQILESLSVTPETENVPEKLAEVSDTDGADNIASLLETEIVSSVSEVQDNSPESVEEESKEKVTESDLISKDSCITAMLCSPIQTDKPVEIEEEAEPAMKKRRLNEPETDGTSDELDFLIRYESIFSEALSDPQSVIENLQRCQEIKEAEKQAVMECCQAEEGSSTFAKLLEKVKDGQSIVVDTVLALLKLCRHTNPSVNKALLEKEPVQKELLVKEAPVTEEKGKSLFELLLEHKEDLIQCITELSPIIECLDTAEEGFISTLEKQVILDCCEGGSHRKAMERLVRKASETKTLSPNSLVKLLQAVREAFPDLHALLEMLEPQSRDPCLKDKLTRTDYGAELLRQYQENFSEVVTDSELMLSAIITAVNLTTHEREVMEQVVKKNTTSKIFSTLTSMVVDEQTLAVVALWLLLLAMQESNPSLKSLMEEIRKEPGADVFFQSVINRGNKTAEVLVRYSELITKAFGQCDILSNVPPEDSALTNLVKELLKVPQQSEDCELPSKTLLSSALEHTVPAMSFCSLLCAVKSSSPHLQPVIKELKQLEILVEEEEEEDFQDVSRWNVNSECQQVVDGSAEGNDDDEEEEEETKDDENEERDSSKESKDSVQEKGSSKKNFICKSCGKIFLFRCRLEVHMKRCRMAKRNPLQCKDCNEIQSSRKELDQHREVAHGCLVSPRTNKGRRRLLVTCDICGKEFAHPSGLQYHKRTEHFDEKPFSCEECGAKFAANSTLKNHQRLHTGERPFVCKHCHMTFTQAAALSYHTKKKHSEGKMYACQYCDAVFAQSIELTRHVRTHTGDKPYVCRECGKGFSQANGLSIHLRTFHNIEDPYDCQKCRMSFPTLEENRQHIQVVHSKEYHPCPTCDKIFSAPSLLERHVVSHVGGKPYNCEICDKAYQQLSGLWYHNRTHHPDLFAAQNHRSYKFSTQCGSCDQTFPNTALLQKHMKAEHPDGKVYECDKCKQTYPTSAALQVHIKCKHSGTQPFLCLYCTDSFQFPGALQHHVATEHFHESENTFGCEICGELFTVHSQLERHYETDHPEVVLTETQTADTQMVQVIQTQDQAASAEQVITLDESHLAGSQVIVALPDTQVNQTTTELVAVSMEDFLDGTVTLICSDPVTELPQRTQS
ncbi:zinc finger and BTB domain-containing protein 40 isoform X1 [Xenopus laevis]|uniref:Zinc finger and BTB domain-containing protein 40 isoform X1 n=1 Tax=Xenopus laevis TaxID=8355 RepID=A0A8J1LCX3_XENLA|nr:zinc finger and BTB domain-containing protein 40 isoform X1 [Xenopus laevis]